MNGIYIRAATARDIERVAGIYEEIHDAEEQGRVSCGWLRGIYPTERTARDALQLGELYVLESGGRIIASAIINKTQPASYLEGSWRYPADGRQVLVLHTLCVSGTSMSKGVGRSFISFYENMARDLGCTVVRIDTQAKNERARKLYASLGYREAGIVPCVFNGIPGVDLVLLEKKL